MIIGVEINIGRIFGIYWVQFLQQLFNHNTYFPTTRVDSLSNGHITKPHIPRWVIISIMMLIMSFRNIEIPPKYLLNSLLFIFFILFQKKIMIENFFSIIIIILKASCYLSSVFECLLGQLLQCIVIWPNPKSLNPRNPCRIPPPPHSPTTLRSGVCLALSALKLENWYQK